MVQPTGYVQAKLAGHAAKEIRKLKVRIKAIRAALLGLIARLHGDALAQKYASAEPPLRSELFSADQMEQRGKRLAATHKLTQERPRDQLLTQLAANEAVLMRPAHGGAKN